MDTEQSLRDRYAALSPTLNEAQCRRWAAVEARALGRGGIALVSRALNMSPHRVRDGITELDDPDHEAFVASGRVRRPGAGRPAATATQPELLAALDRLVDPVTRGDPMSPLRWSSKSTTKLAQALRSEGLVASADTVGRLLVSQGYSLQSRRKTMEGGDHPDRDEQFQHIASQTVAFQASGQPYPFGQPRSELLMSSGYARRHEPYTDEAPPQRGAMGTAARELGSHHHASRRLRATPRRFTRHARLVVLALQA